MVASLSYRRRKVQEKEEEEEENYRLFIKETRMEKPQQRGKNNGCKVICIVHGCHVSYMLIGLRGSLRAAIAVSILVFKLSFSSSSACKTNLANALSWKKYILFIK
jgi:hypothetical protein